MKLRLLRFFAVRVKAASRRRGSVGNYFRRAGAILSAGDVVSRFRPRLARPSVFRSC